MSVVLRLVRVDYDTMTSLRGDPLCVKTVATFVGETDPEAYAKLEAFLSRDTDRTVERVYLGGDKLWPRFHVVRDDAS